jgi:hypothetical protein
MEMVMPVMLKVRDATTTGHALGELDLELPAERITLRELIRSRVYQEVKDYNVRAVQAPFRGLVQPGPTERELNAPPAAKRQIDWRRQFDVALEAFKHNRVLILVDDRQVSDLDHELEIRSNTDVAFVKLVPLVGG